MASRRIWILVPVALLLATGLASIRWMRASKGRVSVLRIGATAPGHLKWTLMEQQGRLEREFAKDGIKIEFLPFKGGQEAMTALATGGIDIAYTSSDPALRTASSGANVRLIALSSFGKVGGSCIAIRSDLPARGIADLKGLRVATLIGTTRHATLAKALKSVGLSLGDVQPMNLSLDASGPAILRGDIDAIVESETNLQPLLARGKVNLVLVGKEHPEWATPSTISANSTFLRRHPDLVKQILRADLDVSRWGETHFDEGLRIFSTAVGQDLAVAHLTYPDGRFHVDPRVTPEAIESLRGEEDFLREAGILGGRIDYRQWLDTTLIHQVYLEADNPTSSTRTNTPQTSSERSR